MNMQDKIFVAFAAAIVIIIGAFLINPAGAQNFIRCQNIVTGDIQTFDLPRCPSGWIYVG